MKMQLFFFSLVAALGGFLFGFDTAVISGTVPFITEFFQLDEIELGWAVSSALVGCVLGSLIVGKPADDYGRKYVLMATGILFLISALGSGLVNDLTWFIFYRFIGGIGVGAASVVAPMYIAEISPAYLRGRLVATNQFAIVVGILAAFFSNYLLLDTGENNWRWMFLAEVVPSILFIGLLFFVPFSPRWLVKKGRVEEARAVLHQVDYGEDPELVLSQIRESLNEKVEKDAGALFRPPLNRIMLIGFLLAMFNQLSGINVIMYYAPMIFQKTGIASESAFLQTVIVGTTNFIFTITAMTVIDRFGRRFLLLVGSVGMTIALGALSMIFFKNQFEGYGVLFCLIGFIAFFAFSSGAIIWVVLSEIFPNRVRGLGQSLGTLTHWAFNFLISFVFPFMIAKWGGGITFAFFASMMLLQFFFALKFLPETKGKTLEELEAILTKGAH